MTTEEHLKLIIGNLNFQIAVLSAELDKAKAQILEPKTP